MGRRRPQSNLTQLRGAIWIGLVFDSLHPVSRREPPPSRRPGQTTARTLMPVITPPVTVRNWLPSGNRPRPSSRRVESGGGDPLVSGHVLLRPAASRPSVRHGRDVEDARVHDPILDVPLADEMATWLKAAAILHGSYAPHRLLRVFIVVLLYLLLSLSLGHEGEITYTLFLPQLEALKKIGNVSNCGQLMSSALRKGQGLFQKYSRLIINTSSPIPITDICGTHR